MLAIMVASPLAWYAMDQWLSQFAYRIDLTWLTFALTGILALIIAVVTVVSPAIRAALAGPVKSFRFRIKLSFCYPDSFWTALLEENASGGTGIPPQ